MSTRQPSHKAPVTTVDASQGSVNDVQAKLSWKLPITYLVAAVLVFFLALKADGAAKIRLNDMASSIDIPDFKVPSVVTLWVFFLLILVGIAWSVISTLGRGKYGKLGGTLDTVSAIGVAVLTVFAFLIFAGGGSQGFITLTSTLGITVAISTPLIFGAMSGVVCEHVGVVNIAIEGQLLVGAFCGVMAASFFQTPYVGLIAAPIAGAFIGSLLALFSVKYGVDQIIVGVVLNVLCLGLTTFFYDTVLSDHADILNTSQYSLGRMRIPGLADIPIIGPMLFDQTILVYIMYVVVALLAVFLYRSRWGLRMRACGEHPRAADTVGINVNRTRILNTILGSAIAGLGGAFFTIGQGLAFTDNMSAGNGYIALAAMILGKWHPIGALGAATMFGFAKAVALLMPNLHGGIPSQLVNMIPYIITIIAVAGFVGKSKPPAAENIPYTK